MAAQEPTAFAKSVLRKSTTATLRKLTSQSITYQSEKAIHSLLQTSYYKSARRISVYLSMPGTEIQTRALVLHALENGKKVFVPYITPRSQGQGMRMLGLRGRDDYEGLKEDRWGIPSLEAGGLKGREETDGDVDGDLDMVVMPAVAFDRGWRRLGHGKGYYDRYLTRYRQKMGECDAGKGTMPLLVGLALSEQLLQPDTEIPTTGDDWLVDAVVTGDGLIHERCPGV